MSREHQASILLPPAAYGRSIVLRRRTDADPRAALARLVAGYRPEWGAFGIGEPLTRALGRDVPGLRPFPAVASAQPIPSTQDDLWIFLRGGDRGEIFDLGEKLAALVDGGFEITDAMETFLYAGGRDLTGYEDGTANPVAEESLATAVCGDDSATPGSSFAAVQRWSHDLARFRAHAPEDRDTIIGRRISDNEEIEDAPETAHVKRTAQEIFEPTAFMVRRSLPYATETDRGLEFVAYGHSLDAFERVLQHMVGRDDGIVDALFSFSRPLTGGYYWCPPVVDGRLDLSAIGL
jgi:porphyrinogen peroxidase